MRHLFVLLVLLTLGGTVLATGEFSTGGADVLTFKGYLMGRFNAYGQEDADPDMGFDCLGSFAWLPSVGEWLDGKAEFKLEPTKYDGSDETGDRNIVLFLEDLNLTADVTEGFSVMAGQFNRPFGYNNYRSGSSMFFADKAIMTGMSGFGSYGKRDIGINLGLEFSPVRIDLALQNGAGDNRPENDSNKQLTARVQAEPVEWMSIGAAVGIHGGGTDTDSTDTWSSTGMDFFTFGSIPMGETSRVEFEGEYMMLGYVGDTEDVEATDGTAMSFAAAPCFDVEAGALTGIQPAIRYETTSPAYVGDTDPENDTDAIDFCVNLHTGSKNTIQIGGRNYSFENEESEGYTNFYVNWRLKF